MSSCYSIIYLCIFLHHMLFVGGSLFFVNIDVETGGEERTFSWIQDLTSSSFFLSACLISLFLSLFFKLCVCICVCICVYICVYICVVLTMYVTIHLIFLLHTIVLWHRSPTLHRRYSHSYTSVQCKCVSLLTYIV